LLGPVGVPIEAAVAQFVEARKALGQVPLSRAVEHYLQRHPRKLEAKTVSEVVQECLAAKRADGLSERYLQSLRYRLGKFAKAFCCDLNAVTGPDLEQWLRQSGLGPRSRNNLRNAVQLLFNFAKARRYLSKDHDEVESVPVVKDRGGKIEVFTPAEMQEILNCASEPFIAFLALGAFAGVRHAEIERLEWKDIRFEDGLVEIHAAQAKTASRRTIPLLDNLRRWLWPRRQKSGLVCGYRNMSAGLGHVVQEVNQERQKHKVKERFIWKRNGLRHSYISYRVAQTQNVAQVSLEAGNTPQMIFRHYRELVRRGDALKWFRIAPKKKEVRPAGVV
jgi:integrase